MFILKCCNCGREQRWNSNVIIGQNTEIEIVGSAIYCTCGFGVEEDKGYLIEVSCEDREPDIKSTM